MHRAGLLFACAIGSTLGALGQASVAAPDAGAAYVPTMTFDVATIRESKPNTQRIQVSGGFKPINSSHLVLENFTLDNLIWWAYPLKDDGSIEGLQKLPDGLRGAYFDVQARSDPETDARLEKLDEKDRELEQLHMMRVLLMERMKLKVHWETRDRETYNLVVSKAGKLHTTGVPPTPEEVAKFGDRGVPPIYQHGSSTDGFDYTAHGASTADIAETLSSQVDHPVVDKTGLTGKYDFDLKTYGGLASDRKEGETNPKPPLESAVQDELGLKIVPSHGPVQVLVVDHVEMPSEN
jgi:uncharacterized protein (TIGR03435 family)